MDEREFYWEKVFFLVHCISKKTYTVQLVIFTCDRSSVP